MSSLKLRALASVCALVGVSALAAQANAATVYGGGSSLLAPYWNQANTCLETHEDLYARTGLTTAPTLVTVASFTPTAPNTCPHDANAIKYISASSGVGIGAVFTHDNTQWGPNPTNTGNMYPSVHYALSDNSLISSDVTIYRNGGTEQGLTVPTTNVANYGQLIQFPVSVDPVTIAYSPVYRKTTNGAGIVTQYSFNTGGNPIKLSQATYCKIFNGLITNWNDAAIAADNGVASLKDSADSNTFSVPIKLVGRGDSSGTTSIFTRHLSAACAGVTGNVYATGATTLGAAVTPGSAGSAVVALYTTATGSGGVASTVNFPNPTGANQNVTSGAIAYIGPDYVLPAVTKTGVNSFGLKAATLQNKHGDFVAPTPGAALLAFGTLAPPTGTDRDDPSKWVETTASTSALANSTIANAYPIVGTTNYIGYTCYHDASSVTALNNFLSLAGGAGSNGSASEILANAGLSALPNAWLTAISNNFVNPTAANASRGIAVVGTGATANGQTNSTCSAISASLGA